jgi:hypothetical protein
MVDLRSINLCFNLSLLHDTDQSTAIDGTDVRLVFNRIRVISGSTVVSDLADANLLFMFQSNLKRTYTDNQLKLHLGGHDIPHYEQNRNYITPIGPTGSLLNCNGILPVGRFSDLHIEFTLERPEKCLRTNITGAVVDYELSDVELHCTYLKSASLSQYYNQNGLSFHVLDYSHRLNIINTSVGQCRFSSSHQSLNQIITLLRSQSNTTGYNVPDKFTNCLYGVAIDSFNLYLNSATFFDQPVGNVNESFMLFLKAYPELANSMYFDRDYERHRNAIVVDLTSAPTSFSSMIQSGTKTAAMNSDCLLRIDLRNQPTEALRADSYLVSDCLIYLENGKGDLKVRF